MKIGTSRRAFLIINSIFLGAVGLISLLAIFNLVAVSFSSRAIVEANKVSIWPKGFNLSSYEYILQNQQFYKSLGTTLLRVILGWIVNITLTVLVAYPLSKDKNMFRIRGFYVWFFLITMVFNGGLIPTYLVVSKLGLVNSIWALILPDAVQMFYILLMLNFFRGIPKAIEEAALVDGANWFVTLFRIYIPLSLPSLATVTLFIIVNHWNSWFDGLIYMNLPDRYPLMTFLQSMILNFDISLTNSDLIMKNPNLIQVTGRSARSAMILLCTLPLLLCYPFLQRYFVSGIVMGSVKE